MTNDAALILTSRNLEESLKKFVVNPSRATLLLTHYGRWVAQVAPLTEMQAGELLEFGTGLFVSLSEPGYGLYVSLDEFCEHRLNIIEELRGHEGARATVLTLYGSPVLQVTPISDEQEQAMMTDAARALYAQRTGQIL